MEKNQSICMEQYSYKENLIYTSKESEIYKAINTNNPNSQPYIFKGYSQAYLTDPLRQRKLMQELDSLWRLHGKENILQIVSQHSRDRKVFIILEFCDGGSLAQQIKKEGKFTSQKSIAYIQQIIKGYSSINDAHLIHRNLQPTSILNAGLQLKIGDFSDSIKQSEANLASLREEIVGNVHYQPYQTLSAYKYSPKSDIYSIGATLYCMLTGKPPYEGANKNQILKNMKSHTVQSLISNFKNPKLSQFLKKTLENDENLRMTPEELINYQFNSMPHLNKLKLYTFDGRDSILIQQQVGAHTDSKTILQRIKQQSKSKQDQGSMNVLFKNFEPSLKKFSAFDLKMSEEDELSKFHKDNNQISIFIPTKIDLPPDESSLMDHLGLDRIESIENRPSQGLPLKKQAGTNKDIANNTYHDLLKAQAFSKNKIKNQTAKLLTIQTEQELLSTNAETQKIKQTNTPTLPGVKSTTVNISVTNQSDVVIPPLEFKKQKITNCAPVENRPSIFKPLLTTERSSMQGPFTLRGRQNLVSQVTNKVESKNACIAGWLISQIDMFRFLNRVVFKIKKISLQQLNELSISLQKLKTQILNDVKNLTHLPKQDSLAFQNSPQSNKIKEIIQAYQSKNAECGQFQGFDKLNKLILAKIAFLFTVISSSNQFKEDEVKLLDYTVTLWQLIKLLKRNNLHQFHNKSKIVEIIDSKQSKLTIAHLLQLYERMKILKLI